MFGILKRHRSFIFLSGYFKYYKRYLVFGLIITVVISIITYPIPLISRYIIDELIPGSYINKIIAFSLLWLAITVFSAVFSMLYSYLITKGNLVFKLKLLPDLIKHIIRLPAKTIGSRHSNELLNRIWNDTSRIQALFSQPIISLALDSTKFLFGIIIVYILEWRLATIVLVLAILQSLITNYFGKKTKELFLQINKNAEQLGVIFYEAVVGSIELKLLNGENVFISKLKGALDDTYKSDMKQEVLSSRRNFLTSTIRSLTNISIVGFGGYLIVRGEMSFGDLFAFQAYSQYLFGPVSTFLGLNDQYYRAIAALERLDEVLGEPTIDPDCGDNAIISEGGVVFKDVSFGYTSENLILNKVSLSIPSRSTIAIVGKSGAGKSTLVSLLLRLYEINKGEILIDDISIKDLSLNALRSQIGFVSQAPHVFYGSIKDNLLISKPDATDQEIEQVIELAKLTNVVSRIPGGINGIIGERGSKISGGERQRLAIARILLTNPKIVILDEATSAIESETEKELYEALCNLRKDRTLIIIAHRLSSVMLSDGIYLLDQGRIVGFGTHHELYDSCELYKSLSDEQFACLYDDPQEHILHTN